MHALLLASAFIAHCVEADLRSVTSAVPFYYATSAL